MLSLSSPKHTQATLRKDLLRKSQKELFKECKKHKLTTSGNKADIVDRIIKYYSPPTSKSSKSKPRSKSTRGKRRNTTHEPPQLLSYSSNDENISSPSFPKITSKSRRSKNGRRPRSKTEVSMSSSSIILREKISPLQQSDENDIQDDEKNDYDQEEEEEDEEEQEEEKQQSLLDVFNQRFVDEKYDKLRQVIEKYNIGYNDLNEITDLTLKILDIDDENDRKELLNEIKNIRQSDDEQETKKEKQQGMYYMYF